MKVRYCVQTDLNVRKPVCIGMFRGGLLTHEIYGATERARAMREAARMRSQGWVAQLAWLNCGLWVRDLWVCDLARPITLHPDRFYGPLHVVPHAISQAA